MQKSGSRIAEFGINDIVNGRADFACARKYRGKVLKMMMAAGGEYFVGEVGKQIPRLLRVRKIYFYREDASKEK